MPARAKGPRLYLRAARRDASGIIRRSTWFIRDTGCPDKSTGCPAYDIAGAGKALEYYLAQKHAKSTAQARKRHPATIPVADVLTLYARDIVPRHARPHETAARLRALDSFFQNDTLAAIDGQRCRAYAAVRGAGAARRELQDLKAAINHHRREGLCSEVIEVVLPPAGAGRDRWLTRSEAARLIWAAWRYREKQGSINAGRRTRQHVARFILVALYTGSRAGRVCGAALQPATGHGWVDIQNGVFYRRPDGEKASKKRATPVRLPPRILSHVRRWKRMGQRFVVEWNGAAVSQVSKAFARAARDAGLAGKATPHVLRHTAATWLMQAGTDKWAAAGYLDMTLETLERRYGHHHPDYQGDVHRGFQRHRETGADAVARRA